MSRPLRTALIGAGRMGAGFANDPVMARHYEYASHAQVLRDHPAFEWVGVADEDEAALRSARDQWQVAGSASAGELPDAEGIEIAVVATPPDRRSGLLDALPGLRGLLVEKPLGTSPESALEFVRECEARGLLVQVNLWRRADERFRSLAAGDLAARVGEVEAVFGVYGNGLLNNGTHMVDLVRMLFGEVASVQALRERALTSPIVGDTNPSFALTLAEGALVVMQAVDFRHYRENSLDVWGTHGRLQVVQEGLVLLSSQRRANRAMQGEFEVAADDPERVPSTVSHALYEMYSNLAGAVTGGAELWSGPDSALRTAATVDAIIRSVDDGAAVSLA